MSVQDDPIVIAALHEQRLEIVRDLRHAINHTFKNDHPSWCAFSDDLGEKCNCVLNDLIRLVQPD